MSALSHRTCARCGTQNLASARVCLRCGQPLPRREDLGELWGVDPAARPGGDGVIDATRTDPSSQVTAPLDRTRPFDPLQPARAEPIDPWSSHDGSQGRRGSGASVSYPPPPASAPVATRSRGPTGCFLGLLAFLIIAAVAGAFGWAVAKPMVSNRVRDTLDHGIATQVAAIALPTAEVAAGQITLTEEEINREIVGYAGAFDPVKNVRVRILPDELRVSFDLYGVTSTYHGGVAVENGRIVVVDPQVSGPAGQLLEPRDVADILETQLAALMDRSNVRPTAVRLRDGALTVTTKRA